LVSGLCPAKRDKGDPVLRTRGFSPELQIEEQDRQVHGDRQGQGFTAKLAKNAKKVEFDPLKDGGPKSPRPLANVGFSSRSNFLCGLSGLCGEL
jgi:hypothetical protein